MDKRKGIWEGGLLDNDDMTIMVRTIIIHHQEITRIENELDGTSTHIFNCL